MNRIAYYGESKVNPNELRAFLVLLSNQLELLHLDSMKQSTTHPGLRTALDNAVESNHKVVEDLREVLNVTDLQRLQF